MSVMFEWLCYAEHGVPVYFPRHCLSDDTTRGIFILKPAILLQCNIANRPCLFIVWYLFLFTCNYWFSTHEAGCICIHCKQMFYLYLWMLNHEWSSFDTMCAFFQLVNIYTMEYFNRDCFSCSNAMLARQANHIHAFFVHIYMLMPLCLFFYM